jgi:hypothetical protein
MVLRLWRMSLTRLLSRGQGPALLHMSAMISQPAPVVHDAPPNFVE